MIPKERLKDILFSKYDFYINDSKQYNLKKQWLYVEDLVNEAIVGVLDCTKEFSDEDEIKKFVLKAIKNIYYTEYNESKKVGGEKFQELFNAGHITISASVIPKRFDEMYDLLYETRFPMGLCCSRCGSNKLISQGDKQYCMMCNTYISITNNTYLKFSRLTCTQLYRLAISVSREGRINYKIFSHASGIKAISHVFKNRINLIKQIIIKEKTKDEVLILKYLLSPVDLEKDFLVPENRKKIKSSALSGSRQHMTQRQNPIRSLFHSINMIKEIEYLNYKLNEECK